MGDVKSTVTLGKRYRDKITEFEGVATARYEYLNGCYRIQLSGAVNGSRRISSSTSRSSRRCPARSRGGAYATRAARTGSRLPPNKSALPGRREASSHAS